MVQLTERWKFHYYMRELVQQYEFAKVAARTLNNIAESKERDATPTFAALQSVLAASAMMSKILWPAPPQKREAGSPAAEWTLRRGPLLRSALEIEEPHVLSRRAVRNSFEHFDNRLDSLVVDERGPVMVDMSISDAPFESYIDLGEGVAMEFGRTFRTDSREVSVLDESIDVQELLHAMFGVSHQAQTWLKANRRP